MALPTDGQNANELDEVTEVPAGKELIFFDPTTNAGGIITLENLTKQILNGIASQAFNLDAGQMTILQALNSLNGKTKPYYSGLITSSSTSVSMHYGIYLVATYRTGGYKISSVSILNIQIQNGSFIEILAKGIDFDDSIKFECPEHEFLFQYKLTIDGAAGIRIYKL